MISNFFVEPFNIEPRPLEAEILPRPISPIPTPITSPALPKPRADPPQQIAARAIATQAVAPAVTVDPDANVHDGPTESDVLLEAIRIVAKREPQTVATRGALRNLIAKFSCEYGLDF